MLAPDIESSAYVMHVISDRPSAQGSTGFYARICDMETSSLSKVAESRVSSLAAAPPSHSPVGAFSSSGLGIF